MSTPRGFWSEGRFLMELMNEPIRRDGLLDPLHKHREELAENQRVGGSPVCRDWDTSEGKRGQQGAKSRITALSLRGAGICLLG